MRFYEVRRQIAAPPDAVWATLTDADRLVAGRTGVARIDGEIAPDATFTIYSEAVPGRGFKTRVAAMEKPGRMVWEGGMPAGLFRGVRAFTLTEREDGTDFQMREEFTGLLLPVIWRTMPDLQPSFDAFADGVAHLSEETR